MFDQHHPIEAVESPDFLAQLSHPLFVEFFLLQLRELNCVCFDVFDKKT